MIDVAFKRTPEQLVDGQRHFLRQHPKRLLPWVAWSLVLIAIVCIEIYRGEKVTAGWLLLGGLGLLITAPAWRELSTHNSFRQSPFFDENITGRFDEFGCHEISEQAQVKLA